MKKLTALFVVGLFFFGCSLPNIDSTENTNNSETTPDGSDNSDDQNGNQDQSGSTSTEYTIQGFAQKGQLIKGSHITAYALGANLVATGESFPAQISDDMGSFIVNGKTSAPYLELNAQGYYFVENSGNLSSSPIYLQAITPAGNNAVNLNLLTTLITPRIKKLMGQGLSFKDAESQAQRELFLSFDYIESSDITFSEMNVSGTSHSDAILLAVSCLIQEGRQTSEVQAMITDIASSLEQDGSVSENLKEALFQNAEDIDIWEITQNLATYYEQKSVENFNVPPFYIVLNEEYASGIHFFKEYIHPTMPNDCNKGNEGGTESHSILCTQEFNVTSNCEWIKVEKTHLIADFYSVTYTIEANSGDYRYGKIEYRIGSDVVYEYEIKQMCGGNLLYIQLSSSSKTSIETPIQLKEGDEVSVNGVIHKLLRDNIGFYVNVFEDIEMYRVGYPVNAVTKDNYGNDTPFIPVQCLGEDYYYCTVTYPASGYPNGVYPFYGIAPGGNQMSGVTLLPCFTGVRFEVDNIQIKDNAITIEADQDIFGTFTYSIYSAIYSDVFSISANFSFGIPYN